MRRGMSIALAVLLLDQASKWWILESVMQPPRVIGVTPFFNLVLAWNTGISFGIGNTGGPWNALILSGIALVIVAMLVVWLRKADTAFLRAALGLVIGGAVGNVIDRLIHGAVVDFLDLHVAGYHWPAFNVADSAIVVGALLIAGDSLFQPKDSRK